MGNVLDVTCMHISSKRWVVFGGKGGLGLICWSLEESMGRDISYLVSVVYAARSLFILLV